MATDKEIKLNDKTTWLYKISYQNVSRKFWIDFWAIFVLGNIIISFFESFSTDVIYPYIEQFKLPQDYPERLWVLFPYIRNFVCLSYAFYSFFIIYEYIDRVKYKKILKVSLLIYYVVFVYVLSWFQLLSPFSTFTKHIYFSFLTKS